MELSRGRKEMSTQDSCPHYTTSWSGSASMATVAGDNNTTKTDRLTHTLATLIAGDKMSAQPLRTQTFLDSDRPSAQTDEKFVDMTTDVPCYWKATWLRLRHMRTTTELCDVTLMSADGATFPAHSTVLAASSETFHGHWVKARTVTGLALREVRDNTLLVEGVSSQALQVTLDFIYGIPPQSMDEVSSLLQGAKVLGIPGAVAYCKQQQRHKSGRQASLESCIPACETSTSTKDTHTNQAKTAVNKPALALDQVVPGQMAPSGGATPSPTLSPPIGHRHDNGVHNEFILDVSITDLEQNLKCPHLEQLKQSQKSTGDAHAQKTVAESDEISASSTDFGQIKESQFEVRKSPGKVGSFNDGKGHGDCNQTKLSKVSETNTHPPNPEAGERLLESQREQSAVSALCLLAGVQAKSPEISTPITDPPACTAAVITETPADSDQPSTSDTETPAEGEIDIIELSCPFSKQTMKDVTARRCTTKNSGETSTNQGNLDEMMQCPFLKSINDDLEEDNDLLNVPMVGKIECMSTEMDQAGDMCTGTAEPGEYRSTGTGKTEGMCTQNEGMCTQPHTDPFPDSKNNRPPPQGNSLIVLKEEPITDYPGSGGDSSPCSTISPPYIPEILPGATAPPQQQGIAQSYSSWHQEGRGKGNNSTPEGQFMAASVQGQRYQPACYKDIVYSEGPGREASSIPFATVSSSPPIRQMEPLPSSYPPTVPPSNQSVNYASLPSCEMERARACMYGNQIEPKQLYVSTNFEPQNKTMLSPPDLMGAGGYHVNHITTSPRPQVGTAMVSPPMLQEQGFHVSHPISYPQDPRISMATTQQQLSPEYPAPSHIQPASTSRSQSTQFHTSKSVTDFVQDISDYSDQDDWTNGPPMKIPRVSPEFPQPASCGEMSNQVLAAVNADITKKLKQNCRHEYVCVETDCDYTNKCLDYIQSHIYRKHGLGIPDRVCMLCGKAFFSDSQLRGHTKRAHREEVQGPSEPVACEDCNQVFPSPQRRQIHMLKAHAKGRLFTCDQCSFRSPRKKDVQAHMVSQHDLIPSGVQIYSCSQCDYKCTDKSRADEHEAMHSGQPKFACTICGKAYTSRRGMRTHLQYHSSERPHVCQICNASFKVRSKLRDHMKLIHTHVGEKPFECGYCSHKTALRGNCNQHIRKHHPGCEVRVIDLKAGQRQPARTYDYVGLQGDGIQECTDVRKHRWSPPAGP